MNLTELKQKPIAQLTQTAQDMGVENVSRNRKQDIIFAILKKRNRRKIRQDPCGAIAAESWLAKFH